jgi:hypothetical protein
MLAFAFLLFVQLSPLGRRQQRLAVLIAETEAARRALSHSFDLWDGFLSQHMAKLKADDMAIAVSSLAKANELIIGDLERGQAASRGQSPNGNSASQHDPTVVNAATAAKY